MYTVFQVLRTHTLRSYLINTKFTTLIINGSVKRNALFHRGFLSGTGKDNVKIWENSKIEYPDN